MNNDVVTVDNLHIWKDSSASLWRATYKNHDALGRTKDEALQNLGLKLVSSLVEMKFEV